MDGDILMSEQMERICKNCKSHEELDNDELKIFLYNCTNTKRKVVISTWVYHNESCKYFDPIQEDNKEQK